MQNAFDRATKSLLAPSGKYSAQPNPSQGFAGPSSSEVGGLYDRFIVGLGMANRSRSVE